MSKFRRDPGDPEVVEDIIRYQASLSREQWQERFAWLTGKTLQTRDVSDAPVSPVTPSGGIAGVIVSKPQKSLGVHRNAKSSSALTSKVLPVSSAEGRKKQSSMKIVGSAEQK